MIYPEDNLRKQINEKIDGSRSLENVTFQYRPREWDEYGKNVGRNCFFIKSDKPIDTDNVFVKFFKYQKGRWRNISNLDSGYLKKRYDPDDQICYGNISFSTTCKIQPADIVIIKQKHPEIIREHITSDKLYKVFSDTTLSWGTDRTDKQSMSLGFTEVTAQMFLSQAGLDGITLPSEMGDMTFSVDNRKRPVYGFQRWQLEDSDESIIIPRIKTYKSDKFGVAIVDKDGNLLSNIQAFNIVSRLTPSIKDIHLTKFVIPNIDGIYDDLIYDYMNDYLFGPYGINRDVQCDFIYPDTQQFLYIMDKLWYYGTREYDKPSDNYINNMSSVMDDPYLPSEYLTINFN